ncbi:MAG: hypothetical protein WCC60_20675, partial [Ilumatobacteraceae bacterium]
EELNPPALPGVPDSLGSLCAQLIGLGITVEKVAGGLCGRPASAPGDFIQARYDVTLADLAKAVGFSADPLNDATDGVLTSLATGLGLDADPASGGWIGDLALTLVVGVDTDGFYIDRATKLELTVGGSLAVSGGGRLGGGAVTFEGTAVANLTVTLAPTQARQRNLAGLLEPKLAGTASMHLGFGAGPLNLAWDTSWAMDASGVTQGDQRLAGTLAVPGLQDGAAGALLDVAAVRQGATWHLTADGAIGAEYTLLGFHLDALNFAADLGPGVLAGSGSLDLTAPAPGGDRTVRLGIDFDRDSIGLDGRLDLPELGVGSPELLRLTDAFVHAKFDATLPAGPLTGGVEIGAATAVVLPATPVGSATGVLGTLTTDGALTLDADTMEASIAGGAVVGDATDVAFRVGPGTGDRLLEIGTFTARFPALDDLGVTFTGFFLTKAGRFGADSIEVASQGLAQSIGLGGLLPFDVTDVTVVFPDNTDLNRFEVSVVGRFDFAAFPDLGGFTPRVGLGGPTVTPDSPPEDNRFTFSVDVVSLRDGIVRPLDVGPITLGFDGLSTGDYVIGAEITLGGFVAGVFQPNVGGSLTVDGPTGSLLDSVTVALDGTITPGATDADPTTADIAGTATLSGTLGSLAITNLVLDAGVGLSFGSGGLTIEPRLDGVTVEAAEFAFGDFMTLRATGASFDPNPPAGGNYLEAESLTVQFDAGFELLAGWSGTARKIAVGDDFLPKLLPGFGFDIGVPADLDVGLPDFIPLFLNEAGVSFPNAVVGPDGAVTLTPEMFLTMRIRLSGGIRATETWPLSAAVDGLEIDLGKLLAGEFPITNLDGLSMGLEPFELPGGVVIGGGLELRTIDVDGTTVFYGRIFGDFAVADIGGGADLVITEYGPVLMKVNAPLGIPLGPTGIVLAGVSGAAQFGAVGIPVPPVGDPNALLNNFTLPTDLQITETVIRDAVRPAIANHQYTWDQGFALSLAGDL